MTVKFSISKLPHSLKRRRKKMDIFECYCVCACLTLAFTFVSLGHGFPGWAFRRQHKTERSVRLCLDCCIKLKTKQRHVITSFRTHKNLQYHQSMQFEVLTLSSMASKRSISFLSFALSVPPTQLWVQKELHFICTQN